ncbi:MAG TPA: MdtA/MuxA family multidrug efflux RND transporter periplasmic adaptor subunit [Pusillimonas sp.]|uniref:MdtA/MuxA family multidrug efflux RND transporter periplasmic adaptor subunit n=1 Tax=unclassified Pusillimonas TaxID=2640016 RepID=UPI0026129D75|nr:MULTISPECIES: MdtA/MuxA family multidrug efflux RND transporter periplasmic adaptor subunit [unclassified Pusillimonas]HLU18811.1 MdtA/MuxA family multidrug efflux RND transporter periplasmic adaptor subunit [Pusillimonas sp.]
MSDLRPEAGRRRISRPWWWAVFIVVVALAAYWYWSGSKPAPAGRPGGGAPFMGSMMGAPVPVRIATTEDSTIDVVYRAIGTVTAYNTVTVRARVDGELQEVLFEDGQKVKKGDVLARIDPRPYQIRLDQALGQQRQNQAQLENAQRDLQRYQLLFKQNSIAKQQVDAQVALVQQYLGSQKSDQAAVDDARLQLSFTEIVAPMDGRLGLRQVDQGNLISAGSTEGLVVLTQTQPISVVFTLPQARVPEVLEQFRQGSPLEVDVYDSSDTRKLATGQLESIDNQIDIATGTLKLKARFENEDETLFPNQFVNVRLKVRTGLPAIVAPAAAIQQGSQGAFVYALDDSDSVQIRRVETGTVEGDKVAITQGLEAGVRVVTEGVDRLREGSRVEIVTATADAARPAPVPGGRRGAPGVGAPH